MKLIIERRKRERHKMNITKPCLAKIVNTDQLKRQHLSFKCI